MTSSPQFYPPQAQGPYAVAPQVPQNLPYAVIQPPQAYQQAPYLPPASNNAVKIDVINPQAYGSPQPQNGYFYNMPQASAYAPQASAYAMPAAGYGAMMTPQYAQAPVQPPSPTTPTPVPAQVPPSVVDQQTAPPQAPPAPPTNTAVPEMDVVAINNALNSDDPNMQAAVINGIATLGQGAIEQYRLAETGQQSAADQNNPNNPAKKMSALINEQTFGSFADSLVKVMNKDTKALPGPQNGQKEPSPQEIAEINKVHSVYTLAILQKCRRYELDKERAAKGEKTSTPITEIPSIKVIVDNLKDGPSSAIRVASIEALSQIISRPEDAETLKILFSISAEKDPDPNVKKVAQNALSALNPQVAKVA